MRAGRWIERVKRGIRATDTIPVRSFRAPTSVPGVDWSDHLSFRRLGLPGVLVTDTSFMRNPNYHTENDRPDTLDYDRMAQLVIGLHGVLWEPPLDDSPSDVPTLLAIGQDITQLKRAEHELRQLKEGLERERDYLREEMGDAVEIAMGWD